jgi:acetyl-CoA C-acetyltransferase
MAAAEGSAAPDPVVGDDRPGVGQAEMGAGLVLPAHIYALFESVRAARDGHSFADLRIELGRLMAPFTRVASRNPNAWFRRRRDEEEIATPSPNNRLVAEPYTKLMTAFLGVDQAAALIVCSLETARASGVGEGQVFVWSGADVNDVWYPAARPDLGSSPAIAEAAGAALCAAGVRVAEVSLFDLYSCFPVAVEMAAEAIGITPDDPRGLTVTGGLPYFGGPGNNYVAHSVATMVERIRAEGGIGLTTGMGWYVTKHSVGVYGSTPPSEGFQLADTAEAQDRIDASALLLTTNGGGEAIVEASTVLYEPDGTVSGVPVIARLADGSRVAAACADDGHQLGAKAGSSLVGAKVRILDGASRYRLTG